LLIYKIDFLEVFIKEGNIMFNKSAIISLLAILIVILNSCTMNNNNLQREENISNSQQVNNSIIFKTINKNNIDAADDIYINLKTSSENKVIIANAATNLAIAHIAKGEHILANYYIQEALQYNSGNEMLRFLLVKNQFLAAAKNSNETTYLQKALTALKSNRTLISNYEDGILADTMLTRVELTIALNNQDISRLYKQLNKTTASEFYREKATIMGIDSAEIVRP